MNEKIKLILDVATNRVIYYTTDYSENLELTDKVITYDYTKPLPKNITPANCWNFKLIGQTLKNTEVQLNNLNRVSEVDFNKKQFISHVNDTIDRLKTEAVITTNYNENRYNETIGMGYNNLILKNYANQLGVDLQEAINQTNDQYKKYRTLLRNLEFLREQYITRTYIANDSSTLGLIRDQFYKRQTFFSINRPEYGELCKIISRVDITEMLAQIESNPGDWSTDQNSQKKNEYQEHIDTIFLARPEIKSSLTELNSEKYDHEMGRTEYFIKYYEITSFLETFAQSNNSSLHTVTIAKLKPNKFVKPHMNSGKYYLDKDSYHLVLKGDYMCIVDEDSGVRGSAGALIWLDNKLEHYSINLSDTESVVVTFDIKPNDESFLLSKYGRTMLLARM